MHSISRGIYGRRRIRDYLANSGKNRSIGSIEKRMKELGIRGVAPRSFVTTTKGAPKLENSPNLLKDRPAVDGPNKAWVSDITFIRTGEGWLYLCVVLDLYSRRIVGWSMRSDLKADILMEAAKMAFHARHPVPI